MKLSDFDFDLPEALIATRPVRPRRASRMLVATPERLIDRQVASLADWLAPGDRLVLNDTKVLPARLFGRRILEQGEAGGRVEVTLLEPAQAGQWWVLAKPLRKWREGQEVRFGAGLSARLLEKRDGQARIAFNLSGADFDAALAAAGQMPLPPYIAAKRPADARDHADYQTVFARHSGAVAAPTASLHFDTVLLEALSARGVAFSHVTLHVGAGTFLPVKVDDISDHKMHAERGFVSPQAADEINATRAAGGRVIAVGTTALRLIETAAASGVVEPWEGATDIFITPGYRFQVTDALMTNFHLPKSTLMMLVSALMGPERVREIYAHAIDHGYRFFSYGDSSLLLPQEPPLLRGETGPVSAG
ncbi:MAG TPA: tRNA preQ1(34) S-adenosylmethionine ribosyltransferase-isomerase QueA [Aliiroseovarius sp.]|nr:tRNA preQ1(34) S-adenosylmethionine ribosyltransferase-isomerase QueA [Aliiroseovarius sp.]